MAETRTLASYLSSAAGETALGSALLRPSGTSAAFPLANHFASSQALSCYNFKPSNTRRLRRAISQVQCGLGHAAIGIIDDSTGAGHGAGTGGKHFFDNARARTPARRMAEFLDRNFVDAFEVGVFGSANVDANQLSAYDPRFELGSGWVTYSAGPGGRYFRNASTGEPLSFAPGMPFDTVEFWFARDPETAGLTVGISGEPSISVDLEDVPPGALIGRTVKTTLGKHTIRFHRNSSSGALRLFAVTVRNSTAPALEIRNFSVAGATIGSASDDTRPWSPRNAHVAMAMDAYFVCLGINDWIRNTPLASFERSYRAEVQALRAVGDVIVVSPLPRAVVSTPAEAQESYVRVVAGIAAELDLPFIDLYSAFETQEIAAAAGYYHDSTHPSLLGAAEKGRVFARAVMTL